MDLTTFRSSTAAPAVPAGISIPLQALWHAAKDDWHTAHRLLQADTSPDAAWVHAYLHRVEGDLSNAGYWYQRAGRPATEEALAEEWSAIAQELLRR